MENESYKQVKQQWNAIYNNADKEKKRWQVIVIIQTLITVILAVGLIILSNKSKIIPYIVEVDSLGRAIYVNKANEFKITDEKIIKSFIYSYITNARSVVTDAVAMKANLTEIYKVSSVNIKQNFLNEYYRTNDPFKTAEKFSIQADPVSFLKQSETSYIVEWKETKFDLTNKNTGSTLWKAFIEITQTNPKLTSSLENNPMNPFGIYITNLSWSKIK